MHERRTMKEDLEQIPAGASDAEMREILDRNEKRLKDWVTEDPERKAETDSILASQEQLRIMLDLKGLLP